MLAALLCQVGFVPPPTPTPFVNKPGRVWPDSYPYFIRPKKKKVDPDYFEEEEEELEEIMAMLGIDI